MTEYEKAMLLMAMAQNEYLHIIAWAHRNGVTNGNRVAAIAKILADGIVDEAPSVAAMLREAEQRI